jgi:hypothetical protein
MKAKNYGILSAPPVIFGGVLQLVWYNRTSRKEVNMKSIPQKRQKSVVSEVSSVDSLLITGNLILINNVFTGDYVSGSDVNIGHEIINIFKSDNGQSYVYVNPHGYVAKEHDKKVKYVIFVRTLKGQNGVKIIGYAEIEEQILINAKKGSNDLHEQQKEFIRKNEITYGKKLLNEIFEANCHEGIHEQYFITFKAKHQRKCINNGLILKNPTSRFFNPQSGKKYIDDSCEEYATIVEWINNEKNWEDCQTYQLQDNLSKKLTILEVTRQYNNELAVSNLLAYALENHDSFRDLFIKEALGIQNCDATSASIAREENDIDILIKLPKDIIIIENKLKSDVSKMQLSKYYKYANKKYASRNRHFFLLRPDYNNQEISALDESDKYRKIRYSEISKILNRIDTANETWADELKRICEIHSKEYDNELFETMERRFAKAISSRWM